MDPQQQPSASGNDAENNQDFQPRPLEQPILDSALRNKIITDSKPAPSGIKGFYRSNKIYVWAIAVGLVIISVLAFFAFRKTPPAQVKEANVDIAVSAPETVPSGNEEIFNVKIHNGDSQKLVGIELELVYPEGVTYADSVPKAENLSGTMFKVPDLIPGPGQDPVVIIKTKVTGNINDQKQLLAKLHYHYSNFSSEFVKEQQFSVRVVASDILLEIDGPREANNAQIIVYSIKYKNTSPDDIKNSRIQASFPSGFSFAESQPQPDNGNNIWNIGTLLAGQDGQITVQGTFSSANPGESKTASVDFQVTGHNGQPNTQATASFTTAINSLPLLVSQELQNSNGNNVINPGDRLTFSIKYQNNAATAATGVNIAVTLDSKALDLSTLQAESGQISGNTITWNASMVPNLSSLNPSDSGQLSFSVNVKNPATRDSSKNMTVVSDIKIKSDEYSTFLPGNKLTLKVASPINLSSGLDFVSGQLPPQVGKSTVYKVTITLKNETNDYSDGIITANILGSGFVAGSFNSSEANKASFDPSAGKLTWNFGSLPAHTGAFSQPKILQFNVRLNPASSQVNQSPILIKDVQLSAKDIFTGQAVTATLDDITTGDISGNQSWNNSRVQP